MQSEGTCSSVQAVRCKQEFVERQSLGVVWFGVVTEVYTEEGSRLAHENSVLSEAKKE